MDEKRYIQTLVRAGKALQAIRDAELRSAPHPGVTIEALNEAFRLAILMQPPSKTSGLVEYHRYTSKLRAEPPAAC